MGTFIHFDTDVGSDGYLALPAMGGGPGVIVCHAWWGRNADVRDVADRLARAGFVALAPDLYSGQVANAIEEAEALSEELASDHARAVLEAAIDMLLAHDATRGDRIGIVGFSLGGYLAQKLSTWRPDAVAAVVTFYSASDADFSLSAARYQVHAVPGDAYEEDEYIHDNEAAAHAAGRDFEVHWYPGTQHWFVEPSRTDAWNPEAAELAWRRTMDFLTETLMSR